MFGLERGLFFPRGTCLIVDLAGEPVKPTSTYTRSSDHYPVRVEVRCCLVRDTGGVCCSTLCFAKVREFQLPRLLSALTILLSNTSPQRVSMRRAIL
jgi:hypothetical protein